ncbi:hypothetical protein IGI04_034976 [Brassica rapa subsp. trilocularis]|uniref:FBD domain-containing protein n=1 Tax=Brassica rapa subsp. trilocularis TaxID=1813537 RepID=A0ABQ7LAB0_BRACM|nr:hypothetical protein IGI04_034976 [Brassica rapa subsp. trilocularis]
MNNQFEALNAPKIDLPFFFLHSYELNTTSLSLSLPIKLKKSKILILHFVWFIESKKLTILCESLSFKIMCYWRSLMCAKEVISPIKVSCLAVDDLPRSRLVNAEVIFAIDFEICFLRRLKVKSSDFIIPLQRQAWTPLDMEEDFFRRLPGSPNDFSKVQTTSRKSRRFSGSPDDFQEVQTTEMEVFWKTSWKSSSALYFKRLTVWCFEVKEIRVSLESFSLRKKKSDIKTYQNTQIYYERETSLEDFHEVQMTSRKSRRLLENFLEVV